MACDLQRLLASAADLPTATLPCEPSVGERILQDSLRIYEEMERQRRQWRAISLGVWPGATNAEMDAVELMRRMETRFAQEAERRRHEERERAWLTNTMFGGAPAQAGGHSLAGLAGLGLGSDDSLTWLSRPVSPHAAAPAVHLTIHYHCHPTP